MRKLLGVFVLIAAGLGLLYVGFHPPENVPSFTVPFVTPELTMEQLEEEYKECCLTANVEVDKWFKAKDEAYKIEKKLDHATDAKEIISLGRELVEVSLIRDKAWDKYYKAFNRKKELLKLMISKSK